MSCAKPPLSCRPKRRRRAHDPPRRVGCNRDHCARARRMDFRIGAEQGTGLEAGRALTVNDCGAERPRRPPPAKLPTQPQELGVLLARCRQRWPIRRERHLPLAEHQHHRGSLQLPPGIPLLWSRDGDIRAFSRIAAARALNWSAGRRYPRLSLAPKPAVDVRQLRPSPCRHVNATGTRVRQAGCFVRF